MSSIERLCELCPPPKVPICSPTASDWATVVSELGVHLPNELFRLCAVYGTGTFRGTETTALSVYCPGHKGFVPHMRLECERLQEIRGAHKTDDHPFDVFPAEGGWLPLGGDENDVWLCWVTKGDPKHWPIVVRWTWGVEGMRTFNLPLTEFLVAILERKIELPCWPDPAFVDDVQFVPYEGQV
jgi:hypothetical protein